MRADLDRWGFWNIDVLRGMESWLELTRLGLSGLPWLMLLLFVVPWVAWNRELELLILERANVAYTYLLMLFIFKRANVAYS